MEQGDLNLLNDPLSQELLNSDIPLRLGYLGCDGTPRVTPIWFHWNGDHIVLGTPMNSPKISAISQNPKVTVTIDGNTWPYKALQIRGIAEIETVDGLVPEYTLAAKRYLGEKAALAWMEQARVLFPQMVRIAIKPEWVSLIDFNKRFPKAIVAAMSAI